MNVGVFLDRDIMIGNLFCFGLGVLLAFLVLVVCYIVGVPICTKGFI